MRATASSPEQARVLANSALHATAQYIENIEKNGSGNNSTATPTPAGEENQESAQNKVSSTNPSDTTNTLIRVIPLDNASVNPPLVSPNYMQNGLIGAGAGLVLVYLAIFLRRSVDQRIRTRDYVPLRRQTAIFWVCCPSAMTWRKKISCTPATMTILPTNLSVSCARTCAL